MANQKVKLSFRVDAGVLEHNNREFAAKNVDSARIKNNIVYKQENLRDKYEELFGAAVEEYNSNQKRNDRKIHNYYEHIENGKQEKLFYEIIVEIGNKDEFGIGTENFNAAKEMLDIYMRDFEKRNPNIKVFNAVLHLDEMTPHLHIDFVPICKSPKRGLPVRNSLKEALAQQGFTSQSKSNTSWKMWGNSEKEHLDNILKTRGYEWLRPKPDAPHTPHKTVDEYKAAQEEIKKINAHVNTLKAKGAKYFSQEDAQLVNNQNDVMRERITEQQEQISALVRRYNSPLVRFDVYNQDKLLYIAKQLDEMHIQYFEEGDALIVPEYILNECKKFAANYKTQATTIKERIKMDIDVYLLSPENLEQLLDKLKAHGYEIKSGKHLAVKPPFAERFTRLKTLGYEYLPENIEKRIIEKDKFPNSVRGKIQTADDFSKAYHVRVLETIKYIKNGEIYPKKQRKNEIYSFENDTIINALSKQVLTLSEFDIHSLEQLYKITAKLEEQLDDDESYYNSLYSEFSFLKSDIQRGIKTAENMRRYDELNDKLSSIKPEIDALKSKWVRLNEVMENYKRINDSEHLNKIIAEQKQQVEFDKLSLEMNERKQIEKAKAIEKGIEVESNILPTKNAAEQNKTYKSNHR